MRSKMKMLAILFLVSTAPLAAQNYGWVKVMTMLHGLNTVEFVDSLHGWAASTSAEIYRTTDGGLTWTQYTSNAGFNVKSISMTDSVNGWCVGGNSVDGFIARTTDGGKTWPSQFTKANCLYLGTYAFSKNKNITCGQTKNMSGPDTARIVITNDGGKTWTETTPFDSSSILTKIQFLDSLNGFMWGYPRLRTRDGGVTWTRLPQVGPILLETFVDTLRGWGGYAYEMHHTTDGGLSWQFQAYLEGSDQLNMKTISFTDSLNGWAFGSIFYKGISSEGIFRTTDGGVTWKIESIGLTGDFDFVVDAKMFNDHNGIAVCLEGSVLRYQVVTSVAEKLPKIPTSFALRQNYPNPFNPTTTIEYELVKRERVTLTVTDLLGRKVKDLIRNEEQEAGTYRVHFDAGFLSSGTYHYTITAGTNSITKGMVLVR